MEKTDSLLSCKLQYFANISGYSHVISCAAYISYNIVPCFGIKKNESKNNSQTLPNSLNYQTEYKNVAFDISEWKRMFRRSAY